MITYEDYKKSCKCLGKKHTMTEEQFNVMMSQNDFAKVRIKPTERPKEATFKNYEDIK